MPKSDLIVMKFGGASLSTAEGISQACRIVKKFRFQNKVVLVVSAMKGVTDQLYEVINLLKNKQVKKALKLISDIKKNHLKALFQINSNSEAVKTESELLNLFFRLENFIKNIGNKQVTPARIDFIVSFGERLSCPIVSNALEHNGMTAYPIDASFVLATDGKFGDALPLYRNDQHHINDILFPLINRDIIPVVTGFIGFSHDGCTTTLGRGGSDLSASYLAYLLDAKGLYLWKDVDGIYTTDPHHNNKAIHLEKLSYDKALELAKKGAKIIYHKAIPPVKRKKIPVFVKSFINPDLEGSIIS